MFPREQLFFVDYEHFKNNASDAMNGIYNFLGLASHENTKVKTSVLLLDILTAA